MRFSRFRIFSKLKAFPHKASMDSARFVSASCSIAIASLRREEMAIGTEPILSSSTKVSGML